MKNKIAGTILWEICSAARDAVLFFNVQHIITISKQLAVTKQPCIVAL